MEGDAEMGELRELLEQLEEAASDGRATFERYREEGQKGIGCVPYFAPYELIHAAGMYPVELWGGGSEAGEASSYYPAFYCSVLITLMDRGLSGDYDYLSGIVIPTTCDGLRNLGENWKCGIPGMPVMSVVQPVNRSHPAAEDYFVQELRDVARTLEDISGTKISDKALRAAITTYNRQRAVMRRFSELAAQHADAVTPRYRSVVYRAARVLPVEVHTSLVERVNDALARLPQDTFSGLRLVSTGILLDAPPLLAELERYNMAIVGDVTTAESVRFAHDAPGHVDPFVSVARVWLEASDTSLVVDPSKHRGQALVDLVVERSADGVLIDIVKFCEEEEFDYPVLKRQLADAGIPILYVETEHQDHLNKQAETRIQAFAEMIG